MEWFKKIAEAFTKTDQKKRTNIIIAIGLIGMALILLSEFWPSRSGAAAQTAAEAGSRDNAAYIKELEEKIYRMVVALDGVGDAEVFVTLEASARNVYASEEKTNTDKTQEYKDDGVITTHEKDNSETKYIFVDSSGKKVPVVLTQLEPTVKGVVVVCEGADNAAVQARILDAVTTFLDVPASRVSVVKMYSQKRK